MSYTTADGRRQVLDALAAAADQLGNAVAYLGGPTNSSTTMPPSAWRSSCSARCSSRTAGRGACTASSRSATTSPARSFEAQQPHMRANDARGLIDSAVEAVARADGGLGGLQDSMLPIEVGDASCAPASRVCGSCSAR